MKSVSRMRSCLAITLCSALPSLADTPIELTSASITDGRIAQEHSCPAKGGSGKSLQLTVRGLPAGTKYIGIVADDPDAVRPAGKVWVHWNLFNVPAAGELTVPAGQPPAGDAGRTSGNAKGYEGMCPPDGEHTYRFAVFAYKEKLELGGFFGPAPMTIDAFESKYRDRILGKALITGKF